MEEILNKLYLSVNDIKEILGIGTKSAREIANEILKEMEEQKYLIINTNKVLVSTKLFRKRLKI